MSESIISRDEVANQLRVSPKILIRYEARGLVHVVQKEGAEGYEPSEIRRIWTIVSCQRDLGINLAGVEAILKLRDHLSEVHRQLDGLAQELRRLTEHESTETDRDA